MKSHEVVYAAADLFIVLGAVSPLIAICLLSRKTRSSSITPCSYWLIFPAISLICALLHNFADDQGGRLEVAQYDLNGDGKGSYEEISSLTDGRPMTPEESHALGFFTAELGRELNQLAMVFIAPFYSAGLLTLWLILIGLTKRRTRNLEPPRYSQEIAEQPGAGQPVARPESKSDGSDKTQPESKVAPR